MVCEKFDLMEDMVNDTLGVNLSYKKGISNEKALKFKKMMTEVNKLLFEGSSHSKLYVSVMLLATKLGRSRDVLYRNHEGCNFL